VAHTARHQDDIAARKPNGVLTAGQPQPAAARENDVNGGASLWIDTDAPRAVQHSRPKKRAADAI
jgi:hypothetical protein